MPPLSQEELQAQELLQAQLEPDEELLAFTRGKANKYFYIGLTPERLILQPLKGQKNAHPISVRRDCIKTLKWSGVFAVLKVQFAEEDRNF
jgi:hypothetical protein